MPEITSLQSMQSLKAWLQAQFPSLTVNGPHVIDLPYAEGRRYFVVVTGGALGATQVHFWCETGEDDVGIKARVQSLVSGVQGGSL